MFEQQLIPAPGTDPHAVPAPYSHTTDGFAFRPEFAVVPYATSKNEVGIQTDTIPVEHGAGTLSETTVAPTVNSCWDTSMANLEFVNDVLAMMARRKMAQSVSCEVCKITCDTKDVFEKHVKGKKHAKNLRLLSSAIAQNGSDVNQGEVLEVTKPMGNSVIVSEEVPKEVVQSFRCEVCKIDCDNKHDLDVHVLSENHKKNVQNHSAQNSLSATAENNNNSTVPQYSSFVMHDKNPEQMSRDVADSVEGELEKKKHIILQNGASVDSLLFCKICNVVCNNQEVFKTHLAGRKHTAQVASGKQASGESKNISPIVCETCEISCSGEGNFQKHLSGKKHQKKLDSLKILMAVQTSTVHPTATPIAGSTQTGNMGLQELPELDKGVTLETRVEEVTNNLSTPWCELCHIGCSSSDNLKSHIAGKRHRKNLEKSKKPIGPIHATAETAPIIGPMENPDPDGSNGEIMNIPETKKEMKRSLSIRDDLETKRQKIMNAGAATDSVRACTVCSVVCNSPLVFISHLAGQKHAAMAMKQTQARFQAQNA